MNVACDRLPDVELAVEGGGVGIIGELDSGVFA
jgi:hypothetical protein